MKKIIVTGGLGFIGSNLIDLLINKNYHVINIDKVSYSSNYYNIKEFKNHKKYKFIKCDIKEKKLKKIIFQYKPSGIFNLAAETHVDRSIDNPENFIQSNIFGVYNLLECFKEYSKKYNSKLIHISTDEVFRVKESRFWWQKNRWPLIEKKMSRENCIEWYNGKDYKTPAKSSCIGCPYHDDSFWLDMKNNRPDEFEAAVEFDKKMRNNSHKIKNYMHRSCKNLDEVVFHVKREEEQMDLFNNECEGMCGV